MAINGWFPALNRKGEVASGAGEIFVEGNSFGPGYAPKWVDDDTIVYNEGIDTRVVNVRTRAELGRVVNPSFSRFSGGGGRWSGNLLAPASSLQEYTLPATPAGAAIVNGWLADHAFNGDFAYADNYPGGTHQILRNGVVIVPAAVILSVSISNTTTVWSVASGATRTTFGKIGAGPATNWAVDSWEDPIVADDDAGDPWVLSVLQAGILLRKGGDATARFRWSGDWFYPDMVFVNGQFKIVASDSAGNPKSLTVSPSSGSGGGGGGPVVAPCP